MNEHSLIYMTKLYDEAMDLNTKLQKELENLKNINEEHRVLNGVLREENKKLRDIINHIWEILDKGYFEDGCDCIKAYDYLQELKHKKIYGSVDSEIVYFGELGSDKE